MRSDLLMSTMHLLAFTLQLMRDTDGDGFVDDMRPTVWDAMTSMRI